MLPQYLPTTGRPYGREPTIRFGKGAHDRHGSLRNTIVKKLMGKNTMLYIAITFVLGFFLVLTLSGTPPEEPKSIDPAVKSAADDEQANAPQAIKSADKSAISELLDVKHTLGGILRHADIVVLDGHPDEDDTTRMRRRAVREAFQHAYHGYEKKCFGEDELKPNTNACSNWLNQGLTIVDAIDTMLIMGLRDEYKRARTWIDQHLHFDRDADVSLFETNIRIMGGFLTAFDFTGDRMYLEKAIDLGNRLLKAFKTKSGLPHAMVNLKTGDSHNFGWTGGQSILAEVGTLQIEFSYLSHLSGNMEYHDKALKIFEVLVENRPDDKLFPVNIDPDTGHFTNSMVSLGAFGDSFYEYLIKYHVVVGKAISWVGEVYFETAKAILERLKGTTKPSGLVYIGEMQGGHVSRKVEQLSCFAGGMFALGAHHAPTAAIKEEHMEFAKGFGEFCYETYHRNPTGLAGQHVFVNDQNDFTPPSETNNRFFALRPETVETLFYLYRFTNDTKYRDWGWEIFESINKHCRNENGYAGLRDVTTENSQQDDKQQSWFLAETLKYLFLLFSPHEFIPLDKYVFNTEAHPIHIFDLKRKAVSQ